MIDGFKQSPAIIQLAKTIEAHGIQPLEDVTALSVLRRATVLLDEALYLFEPGDDSLFAGRLRLLASLDFDAEIFEKRVVLFGESSHARPPPSCGRGRPRPRPCASP